MPVSDDDIIKIAKAAAREAVHETLLSLGMNIQQPLDAQRDFATLRELRAQLDDPEWVSDQIHLRKWRKSVESVTHKSVLTVLGLLVTGLFGAIWIGMKDILNTN